MPVPLEVEQACKVHWPVWDVHIHAYDADDGLSEKHGYTHITRGRHRSAH